MAGLSKDGRGWRVTFTCPTSRKQRTIRLDIGAKKDAETARNMIERLITARSLGTPINQQTAEWLKSVGDTLRNRLAKNDLTEQRVAAKLGEFTRRYIDGRTDLKDSTKKQIEHARTDLVDFFKEDKFLHEITEADAEDWALWLWLSETRKLGENTKARRVGRARQFFNRAIKENILTENPFRGIKRKFSFLNRRWITWRDAVKESFRYSPNFAKCCPSFSNIPTRDVSSSSISIATRARICERCSSGSSDVAV